MMIVLVLMAPIEMPEAQLSPRLSFRLFPPNDDLSLLDDDSSLLDDD